MKTKLGNVLFVLVVMAVCLWPTWGDWVEYQGWSGVWQNYTSSLGDFLFNGLIQAFWLALGAVFISTVKY